MWAHIHRRGLQLVPSAPHRGSLRGGVSAQRLVGRSVMTTTVVRAHRAEPRARVAYRERSAQRGGHVLDLPREEVGRLVGSARAGCARAERVLLSRKVRARLRWKGRSSGKRGRSPRPVGPMNVSSRHARYGTNRVTRPLWPKASITPDHGKESCRSGERPALAPPPSAISRRWRG